MRNRYPIANRSTIKHPGIRIDDEDTFYIQVSMIPYLAFRIILSGAKRIIIITIYSNRYIAKEPRSLSLVNPTRFGMKYITVIIK
jgi:hypothetical protein